MAVELTVGAATSGASVGSGWAMALVGSGVATAAGVIAASAAGGSSRWVAGAFAVGASHATIDALSTMNAASR